jgi:hypothetical protein
MPNNRNFESDDHALFTGAVIGAAWRLGIALGTVPDADGNYLPRWRLEVEGLPAVEVDVPRPPEGWTYGDMLHVLAGSVVGSGTLLP